MRYDALKRPYKICNVEIPNRFVVIPMTMGGPLLSRSGSCSEESAASLENIVSSH